MIWQRMTTVLHSNEQQGTREGWRHRKDVKHLLNCRRLLMMLVAEVKLSLDDDTALKFDVWCVVCEHRQRSW